MEFLFRYLGFSDVRTLRAEGMAYPDKPDRLERAKADARAAAAEF